MDNQVKAHFKNNRFGHIDYLANEESWNEDEHNLGVYYFLKAEQGGDTSAVFQQILLRKETQSSAYNYLGDVARKLFDIPYSNKVAAHYFSKALEQDGSDAAILWNLYDATRDTAYLLKALQLDYQEKQYSRISNNLRWACLQLVDAKLKRSQWELIKRVCLDDQVLHCKEALIVSYYYLGDYQAGVESINSIDEGVTQRVLDLYIQKDCFDLSFAISRATYFGRMEYSKGDPKREYEEIKAEALKGKLNPTKEVIIKHAFAAHEYQDVLSIMDTIQRPTKLSKLYHLLSSQLLGVEVNTAYEASISSFDFKNSQKTEANALYMAYRALREIDSIKAVLNKEVPTYDIAYDSNYISVKAYLDDEALLSHPIHDLLVDQASSISKKWKEKYVEDQIRILKSNEDETEAENLASYLIDAGDHLEALDILNRLSPTMTVNNMLGVCYSALKDDELAFKHYQYAYKSMRASGEENHIIISNYLSCIESLPGRFSEKEKEELVSAFNHSIPDHFRNGISTAKKHRTLYKYYPFNQNTLDALVNGYFYLASAEQLNDPIELPFESLNVDTKTSFLRPNFRLTSFSDNENSMLMWSHYTTNHEGLMVEYTFENKLPKRVGMARVNYYPTDKRLKEMDFYLFDQHMLTKNKDWSYENEVRLFAYEQAKIYYEQPSYPKKCNDKVDAYIKSITVGYKFPESTIRVIKSIVADLNNERDDSLPSIKLRRAKISAVNCFELEYEDVD